MCSSNKTKREIILLNELHSSVDIPLNSPEISNNTMTGINITNEDNFLIPDK